MGSRKLVQHDIVKNIFVTQPHEALMQQSTELLRFMAAEGLLSSAYMWRVHTGVVGIGVSEVVQMSSWSAFGARGIHRTWLPI